MSTRDDDVERAWPHPPFWLRWKALPEWTVKFVMAATVAVGIVIYAVDVRSGASPAVFLSLVVAGAACLTAWHWRWPTLCLAVAAPVIGALAGIDPIIEWNLAIFATVTLTMHGMPVWLGLIPSLSNYAATVVHYAGLGLGTVAFTYRDAVIAGASTFVFGVIGHSILISRRYWEQVRLRSRDLAAAQDVAVARGVAEERLRIARDLHDVIGHELAVVNIHLGAAEVHLPAGSDEARGDLAAARGNIQHILTETQHMLKILRTQDEPESASSHAPLADYEHIGELIEQCHRAGVEVETAWPQTPPVLLPEAARAAYRIVQECLTNATKYGTGTIALHITTNDRWLFIEVVNRQAPVQTRSSHTGYGLVGMRERVASVGGALKTSNDGDLFWVQARLPLVQPTREEEGL